MDPLERYLSDSLDPFWGGRAPQPGFSTRAPAMAPPTGMPGDEDDETRTGQLGRELTGPDPVGAFARSRQQGQAAREAKLEALRAARERLTAPDPSRYGLAALGAAAGLLAPTRTGATTESISRGLSGALPFLGQERQFQERRDLRAEELGLQENEVGVQDADRAYREMLDQLQLGTQLTGRADQLRDRREARIAAQEDRKLQRESLVQQRELDRQLRREIAAGRLSTVSAKPLFRVVPKVGLVRIDPGSGTATTLIDTPGIDDPSSDPKLRVQALRMIQGAPWFKERQWGSPEAAAAAASRFVDQFLKGTLDLETGAGAQLQSAPGAVTPPPGPSGTGPGVGKRLVAEEFDLDDSQPQPGPQQVPGVMPPMIDKSLEAGKRSEKQFTGKELAKWADETAAGAMGAIEMNDQIDYLRGLDAKTGRLAPAKEFIGQWADQLNLGESFKRSIKEANDLTAFNAIVSRQLQSLQTVQKGVQTEGDAKRFKEALGKATSPEAANELIWRQMKAVNYSAAQQQRFVDHWQRNSDGGSLFGPGGNTNARSAWLDYRQKLPLVGQGKDGSVIFLNEYLEQARKLNPDEPGWEKKAYRSWQTRFGGGVR